MVNRIYSEPTAASSCKPLEYAQLPQHHYRSTIVSAKEVKSQSFFWTLLTPIIWFFEWLESKLTLTTEELEMFEDLLEGAFWGGAAFFYKREIGETRLREVVAACEELYKKLGKKWFPNIEGIFFMRGNLIKIKMRAYAALGEKDKVKTSLQELKDIGVEVADDVKLQTQYLLAATKPGFRVLLSICNGLVQAGFKVVSLFK